MLTERRSKDKSRYNKTIEKQRINESKTEIFEKINKIDKLVARFKRKSERERMKISKIRGESGVIATILTGINQTIRKL